MGVWRGPRGIEIEAIMLDQRQRLRITQTVRGRRYLVAYCASIREVEQHVPLADLVEVIDLRAHAVAPALQHPADDHTAG